MSDQGSDRSMNDDIAARALADSENPECTEQWVASWVPGLVARAPLPRAVRRGVMTGSDRKSYAQGPAPEGFPVPVAQHVIRCRSCGNEWADPDCTCTCVEGQELPYEDWVIV